METVVDQSESLLVTVGEVARLLGGLSTRTVWRYLKEGKLPQPVRFSRKTVRWRKSDIVAHCRAQESSQGQ